MEAIFVQLAGRKSKEYSVIKALIVLLVVFALLTIYVKLAGPNNPFNSTLYIITVTNRVSYLNGAMVIFSEYGREYFWIPLVALMWLFGRGKVKFAAYVMIIAFILSIIAGELLKPMLAVPRPFHFYTYSLLIAMPHDFSYPSGHALIVWAGASSTFYYLRRRYVYLLSLEAAFVSFSRVYVGVHWPLDVIDGAVLGASMAMLAMLIAESGFGQKIYDRVRVLSVRERS